MRTASTTASSDNNSPRRSTYRLKSRVLSIASSIRTYMEAPFWCRLAVIQLSHLMATQVTFPLDANERLSHGNEGINIQGMQLDTGWSRAIYTPFCNRSIYTCTHTKEYSIQTDGHIVYLQDHMTQTPSLANPPVQMKPPRDPLHGPVTWNPAWTQLNILYACLYVYGPVNPLTSRSLRALRCGFKKSPISQQVPNARNVVGIVSSLLTFTSDLI